MELVYWIITCIRDHAAPAGGTETVGKIMGLMETDTMETAHKWDCSSLRGPNTHDDVVFIRGLGNYGLDGLQLHTKKISRHFFLA